MRAPLILVMAATLIACGDKDEDTGTEGEILEGGGGDGEEECAGTPPVIDSVTCTASAGDVGDGQSALLIFDLTGSDDDGDLDAYTLSIYLDDTIDGVVVPEDSPYGPSAGSTTGDECTTFEVILGLNAGIPGTYPAYETRYEWGLVLTDGNGYDSDIYTVACTTPAADGSGDADPEDT